MQIPMEKYDDITINLIKEFSLNAMQVIANSTSNSCTSINLNTDN